MVNSRKINEWVAGAKAGEQAAWGLLYRYFYPMLYSTALRICKDVSTSKDMVQETCITAYLKVHQVKDVALFGAWIRKILVRNCYRARLQKQGVILVETITGENDTEDNSTQSNLPDTLSNIHAALAQLPEVLRSTMLLRYFSEHQSYEEIAGILSIPVGTVRSRLNEAKRKMVLCWQDEPVEHDSVSAESQEWNGFYEDAFSAMHQHDQYKNKFIRHLQTDVRILAPNGRVNTGSAVFEKMIVDDRQYGSWLYPVNVVSCGNISIIESRHYNSAEHPSHCPPASVMVLYRDKKAVNKMSLYLCQV